MPKIFLDTNIWFYAFVPTQNSEKHIVASQIIQNSTADLYLSVQIINELSVNLKKKASFSETQLTKLVQSFYANYQVVGIFENTFLKASELRTKRTFSYWDSMVVASAFLEGCDILYSEDMHHSLVIDNQLTIQNPFI